MPTIKRPLLLLLFAALVPLVLSSCTFIRIQNVSAAQVTLLVHTPDSNKPYTRIVSSGAIVDVFSSYGGRYTIQEIPSEQYKDILDRLENQITTRLFEEAETLSAEEVRQLTENLNHVLSLQEQLSDPGPTCSGHVSDFETAVVTTSYDNFENQWILECGSSSGE